MSIDQNTVRRIARLARIRVEESDLPRLEGELNSILRWIEMLNEVDTTDVEPMTSVVKMSIKMRDDVVTEGQDPDGCDRQCSQGRGRFLRRAQGD